MAQPDPTDNARAHLVQLLGRVAERDRNALKSVYDLTSAKLFGICLRILNDRGHAEDALQDVYIKVWRGADRFDAAKASPVTWLAAIARNTAIDRKRSLGSRTYVSDGILEDMESGEPGALEQLEAKEKSNILQRCLGTLDAKQENVIRTAFFEGDSYTDLAKRLDTPLGTVKSWVRRGLKRLKDCIDNG